MAGVYGDMLLAWPEQMRTIEVYDMTPKVNGGWDKVLDENEELITQSVTGVFQNTRGGGIKNSNGNLVQTEGCEFWTHSESLDGKFFNWNNKVYRLAIPDTSDWLFEGGFCRYGVEKVVGNNATESEDTTWNTGGDTFS